MKELKNLIAKPEDRQAVISDCVALVNSEVDSKTGFSGAAVKMAFAVVKALKPKILEELVDGLLDEFVAALEPFYAKYQEAQSSDKLEKYLRPQSSQVAEALLSITDRRAQKSTTKVLVKAYEKLRPKGKVHVEEAVPGIGRVLDKHVGRI